MVTTGALGSKPNAQTSALLFPAGVILLILTFLPFVYIIPYYINMILQVRRRAPAARALRAAHAWPRRARVRALTGPRTQASAHACTHMPCATACL